MRLAGSVMRIQRRGVMEGQFAMDVFVSSLRSMVIG